MTTLPGAGGLVPQWTLGDRLRKAREYAGFKVPAFADLIGVSSKTINNAESGRHGVRPITLNAWALASGVSREWLETGEGDPTPKPGPGTPATSTRDAALARLADKKRRHAGDAATRRYGEAA